MGQAKRRQVLVDTVIPRIAPMISDAAVVRPRGVSDGSAGWLNCFYTSRDYVRDHGGEVVFGFIVEVGHGSRILSFNYHAIVRQAGEFIDPNYKPNRAPLFLPDPSRPYDYEEKITWNDIVVFSELYHCPITDVVIPAWTPAAKARVNEQSAYSLDQRHFCRKHFKEGDDYQSYIRGLGLDPDDDVDLCFTTNIERVYVAVEPGQPPPKMVKDFKLEGERKTLPNGIVPKRLAEIRSEAENERIGRRIRDG